MSEVVDKLTYALDYDLAGTKAKAREAEADAQRLGGAVKAATKDAFDPATAGAAKLGAQLKITAAQYQAFAKEAAATGRSVDSLIAAHMKVGRAAEVAGKQAVGAIKLQSYQITNLAAQAQDVLVSLGSGQNPLTVLLQQGPQATSAAGGVSNAFKLLGGAAGVARLAIGGLVVGGIGALVTASIQGQNEVAGLERRLALIGGAAGVTRGQIELMSRSIDGVGRGNAREILGGLAGGGNVPSSMLPQATQMARNIALGTGQSNQEAVEFLNEILSEPAKGARKLAEDFNALSAADLRQIETLVASGRAHEAAALIIQNAGDNFGAAAASAGTLERAMRGAAEAAGSFWSFVKGIGRPETADEEAARRRRLQYPSPILGALLGPQFGPANRDRLQFLENQAEIDRQGTSMAERSARNQEVLRGADSALAPFAVEASRKRTRENAVARARATLTAANEEGDVGAMALAREALRNAQNPNYRPGSGVPAGRAGRIDTGARDAELARMEVANARALAAAPARDREALRARQQAEAEFIRNSADPRRRGAAAGIRDSRMEAFGISQAGRQADVVTAIAEETAAQLKMADAYAKGTAAAAMQIMQGQAHAAWLQGQIANEDEYARALAARAAAQARATTEQSLAQQRLGNAALGRLVAAGGDPAAMETARIENEALAATQAARDTAQAQRDLAKSTEEIAAADLALAAAETALATARKQGGETSDLQRQIAVNDNNRAAQDSLQLKEAEIKLAYASTEARIKEISAIQAYQQTVREGFTVGSSDFQSRYDELRKINEQLALADATLSGQTRNVQVLDAVRQGLGDIAMAGTRGFRSMEDAASSFFRQLGDLIVQLYVIEPLLNGLLGTSKSGGGGLIGNFISGLFGGGSGGADQNGNGFMASGDPWQPPAKGGGIGGWLKVLGSLPSFGGPRAMGGPVSSGKAYLVGENAPELFVPNAAGNIVPLRAPNATAAQSGGGGRQEIVFNYNVTVSGNGDAELLARMQMIAGQTVQSGLEQYSAADNRSLRQRVQQSGRRALR